MPASGGKAPWKTGKKALKAKGAGIDFKRVKSKVGRKLPPPTNATKTDFKSKAIVIPGQSVAADKDGVAVNQRNQTLKELLTQSMHYSEKVRKEALIGLKDLFTRFPTELPMHAMAIVEKLSPRITDYDKAVRQTLLLLLRTTILPGLPQGMMAPLVPGLMAHVSSAMTHLVMDVRASACSFLDLLVQHYPDLVVSSFSGQIVQHYVDLLGKGGVSGQAVNRVGDVLSSLVNFLTSLKTSISTQPLGAATNGTRSHCWGQKYTASKQMGTTELRALHGHNSRRPNGYLGLLGRRVEHGFESGLRKDGQAMGTGAGQQTGVASKRIQNTGVQGQVIVMAAPLVPVLIDCWADCAPTVCAGPMPDAVNLRCMVSITQALSLLFQCFSLEGSARGLCKSSFSSYFVTGEEDWEMRIWMRQHFLSGLQKHVLAAFPVAAPSIRLPAKVEEDLVALNVGICEVMLYLIVPPHKETENKIEHYASVVTLQYYESALYGMMLPSSEMAAGVVDSKLAEPHLKLLISHLPVLLSCITHDWIIRLLQAFTKVFESSKAHSAIKLSCLSAMAEILLSQGDGGKVDVPLQFQKQWMQALPRLLWELKHTHVSVTQAVLQMLLHIGRSAPEGSTLSEEYAALQPHMIPFFCTFLASSKSEGKCLFGPFVKLSRECQELAVDTMCYWRNFSSPFLKAMAHCCVSDEVSLEVAIRVVEVFQNVFMRGSSGLAEHLSFLVTLLAGHTTAQAGREALAGVLSCKARIKSISESGILGETIVRRKIALAGVVCSSLTQLGDCNLVLYLLGPSIQKELVRFPSFDSVHSFLCAVAVLSTDKRSDSSDLPEALRTIIPQCVAEFLIAFFKCESLAGGDAYSMVLQRPCFLLLSRSQDFTHAVLSTVRSFLTEVSQVSAGDLLEDMCAVAQTLLLICKQEKLLRVLSNSKDSLIAILGTLQAYAAEDKSENLRPLYSQLDIIVAAI
ncbi:hypothetical protein KC19_1G118100 [Ceratodon purpureus]|uniref:Pre-rRNA-processing protein Ipi1 N-terminal domain-containing protein n=1 Tax=Ceratodon purpureus TaxID=3225 RepID=A0A8T0J7A7_CERPU|nr:hypothetical protein KC19_1G118100 [Ceratodon purpureus]